MRVRVAGNAQRGLRAGISFHIGQNGGIGNGLNQACAKNRSRDAENNVWIAALACERISRRQEVELGDVAAGSIAPPGDHEEGVHVAVRDAVALLEALLAGRTIWRNEPGDGVLRSVRLPNFGHGILRGARSPGSRLGVAGKALVGVETRAESIVRAALRDL